MPHSALVHALISDFVFQLYLGALECQFRTAALVYAYNMIVHGLTSRLCALVTVAGSRRHLQPERRRDLLV